MSVAIEKIEGVKSVNVSLNKGLADVKLEPGNQVKLENLRRVVRNGGFTPKEAEIVAVGRTPPVEGEVMFEVTGTGEAYVVADAPGKAGRKDALLEAAKQTESRFKVQGLVEATDGEARRGGARGKLLVKEFEPSGE